MRARRPPDFFLIGAPKAGTSALHAALAAAPAPVPEPGQGAEVLHVRRLPAAGVQGARRRAQQPGVGLAARALPRRCSTRRPDGALRGESTPFYLYNRDARRRIAVDNPDAKLIAVLRDPVDRAYSNWMHLWMDGLEPCADVVEACAREQKRIDAGWAPFWHYRASACTAGSSRTSSTTSRASRCCCCATATSSTTRDRRSTAVCRLPRRRRRPVVAPSPARQLTAVRAATGPRTRRARLRSSAPGAAVGAVPAAPGVAPRQQAADQPAARAGDPPGPS